MNNKVVAVLKSEGELSLSMSKQLVLYNQSLVDKYESIFQSSLEESQLHPIGKKSCNDISLVSIFNDPRLTKNLKLLKVELINKFGVNARFQNIDNDSIHITIFGHNFTDEEIINGNITIKDIKEGFIGLLPERRINLEFKGLIPTKDAIIIVGFDNGKLRGYRDRIEFNLKKILPSSAIVKPNIIHSTICVFDENSTPLTTEQKMAIYEYYKNHVFGYLRIDNAQLLRVPEYAIYPGKENVIGEITF